jgi:hypothetical protein
MGHPLKLPLTNGGHTLISPTDLERFGHLKWGRDARGYARCSVIEDGRKRTLYLHREILELRPGDGWYGDHINGDKLDNRRFNLRVCTHAQNTRNSKSRGGASQYIGVHKYYGVWRTQVILDGRIVWRGEFRDEVEAAQARDVAARKYHGRFARLNFPKRRTPAA